MDCLKRDTCEGCVYQHFCEDRADIEAERMEASNERLLEEWWDRMEEGEVW